MYCSIKNVCKNRDDFLNCVLFFCFLVVKIVLSVLYFKFFFLLKSKKKEKEKSKKCSQMSFVL
jgi:hypothetical protein